MCAWSVCAWTPACKTDGRQVTNGWTFIPELRLPKHQYKRDTHSRQQRFVCDVGVLETPPDTKLSHLCILPCTWERLDFILSTCTTPLSLGCNQHFFFFSLDLWVFSWWVLTHLERPPAQVWLASLRVCGGAGSYSCKPAGFTSMWHIVSTYETVNISLMPVIFKNVSSCYCVFI